MTVHPSAAVSDWCTHLPGSTRDNPFGPEVDVHRVGGKIFALVDIAGRETATLKAVPDDAAALVAMHAFVIPGYHMNKRHWITIDLTADVDRAELKDLIAESHRIVFESLTKRMQHEILFHG